MIPPEKPVLKPYVCDCGRRTEDGQNACHGDAARLEKLLAKKEAEAKEHFENNIRLVGEDERLKAELEDMREKFRMMIQQDHGSCFRLRDEQAEVIRIAREHLEKIAEASISHRLMPFAAQQALDKMNRGEGK